MGASLRARPGSGQPRAALRRSSPTPVVFLLSCNVAKRRQTPNRERDINQRAKQIVAIASGEVADELPEAPPASHVKRGEARAAKLTPAQRKRIAKKAARTRWGREG